MPRWWRFNEVFRTSPGNAYTNVVARFIAPPLLLPLADSLLSVRFVSPLLFGTVDDDDDSPCTISSSTKLLTSCKIFRAISSPSFASDASGAVVTFSLIRWISMTTFRLLEKNFLLVENRAVRYFQQTKTKLNTENAHTQCLHCRAAAEWNAQLQNYLEIFHRFFKFFGPFL